MNWKDRLLSCENFVELVDEFHSICWSMILNKSCLRESCDVCPCFELFKELREKFLEI